MLQQYISDNKQKENIVLYIAGKKIIPGKGQYALKGTPGPVAAKILREAGEKGIFKDSFEDRMESEDRKTKKLKELFYDYEEF